VITETINVKGQSPVAYQVYFTHRGVLVQQNEILEVITKLFGAKIPIREEKDLYFSLAWTGFHPKETFLPLFEQVIAS